MYVYVHTQWKQNKHSLTSFHNQIYTATTTNKKETLSSFLFFKNTSIHEYLGHCLHYLCSNHLVCMRSIPPPFLLDSTITATATITGGNSNSDRFSPWIPFLIHYATRLRWMLGLLSGVQWVDRSPPPSSPMSPCIQGRMHVVPCVGLCPHKIFRNLFLVV